MKNLIKIFLVLIFFVGCTKKLLVKDINLKANGHLMFGKIPAREFYYPFNVGDSLKEKWTTDTKGSFNNTSMTFLDSSMFISDLSGNVYVFNINTGKELGKFKNKGAVNIAPMIYGSRAVFVVEELKDSYSTIYFYDVVTGDVINEHEINGSCSNELIKSDDQVVVISDEGIIYSYSLIGVFNWKLDTEVLTRSVPALRGNYLYIVNINGELLSIDLKYKKITYREKISKSFQSGITLNDRFGYAGDEEGTIFCLNLSDGSVKWKIETDSRIRTLPVMNKRSLFVGNLSGDIYSLNKRNGKVNWIAETGGLINATPLLFNDYLVQPDLFKRIYFVNIITGEISKEIPLDSRNRMSPVYFNNTLYFGIDKGEIIAYEIIGSKQ